LQLPIVSKHLYDKYVASCDRESVEEIIELNRELPIANYLVLKKTIEMLYLTKENGAENEVNSVKLATIFGELIMRPKDKKSQPHQPKQCCLFLIQNFVEVFKIQEEDKKLWPTLKGLSDDEPDEYKFPIEIESNSNGKSFKLVNIARSETVDKSVKFKGDIVMKNNFTKKWKPCYVILRQDKMIVYNSKEDFKNGKTHIVSLFMEYAVVEDEEVKDHKYTFSIFSRTARYYFECDSLKKKKKWMDTISEHINSKYQIQDAQTKNRLSMKSIIIPYNE
jgi:hypothetical protein